MEATNYTSIGPVLQLNKAGELIQKRMKAVKVCDGLYITEPNKSNFVRFIIECNGVMWVESNQSKSYVERYAAMMPEVLKKVKAGFYNDAKWNNYCHEIDRRINHPDSPGWANYPPGGQNADRAPEIPKTVDCVTDAPKSRETARKPQNRGIGSKRTTRRDTLRDTLRPVTCVPRECSTADAAYWQPRPNSLLVDLNEFQNIL